MTIEQRNIIGEFLEAILKNSESGDLVNCYNDGKSLIKELCKTDEKLNYKCEKIEIDFEQPF